MATEDATRDIKEIRADVDAIREQVAKYKADSERLDWLERNTILAVGAGIQWEELGGVAVHEWHGEEPLRDAIDEAMKAGL